MIFNSNSNKQYIFLEFTGMNPEYLKLLSTWKYLK